MYPDQPPMWFSESEDGIIADIVESVSKISTSSNNLLLCMLRYIVMELLKTTDHQVPTYVENLDTDKENVSYGLFCIFICHLFYFENYIEMKCESIHIYVYIY